MIAWAPARGTHPIHTINGLEQDVSEQDYTEETEVLETAEAASDVPAEAELDESDESGDAVEAEDSFDEIVEGEAPEAADDDPLEAFRRELWAKPGDWFVIHTYSGMENRVKSNLENRIVSLNMEDYIHEIVVPTEEVPEIKNGQRKMVTRTVLPLSLIHI